VHDYHVHSNYSDGDFLFAMASAAADAGIDGLGVADHCIVTDRPHLQESRETFGFTLDRTHDRRRRALDRLQDSFSIPIYDAVEMDYHPKDEAAIETFLDDADFDYVIGSVHEVDGRNVQAASQFTGESEDALDAVVESYVERLVDLIESELFDIAAHPDLVERTAQLAGRLTADHYERIAAAFANSRTLPEINAGRALGDVDIVHPREQFLTVLREYDCAFSVGTDAHAPEEIDARATFLDSFLEDHGIEPVGPSTVL
jgi:histidinol-phosphatase (PHP family)